MTPDETELMAVIIAPPIRPDIRSHFRSPEEVEELRKKYLEGLNWGRTT